MKAMRISQLRRYGALSILLILLAPLPAAAVQLPQGMCSNYQKRLPERARATDRDIEILGDYFKRLDAIDRPASKAGAPDYERAVTALVQGVGPVNVMLALRYDAARKLSEIYETFGNLEEAIRHKTAEIDAANDARNNLNTSNQTLAHIYLRRALLLRRAKRPDQALADARTAQQYGCGGPYLDQFIADMTIEAEAQTAAVERRAAQIEKAIQQGLAAEQSGDTRRALAVYMQSLTTHGTEELPASLVIKAIDAALKVNPPPPIPEEARKHAVFAQTAFKEAKGKGDFHTAREQYSHALALAPWWADAWVTLSAVHERLDNFAAAATDLENYLRAAPGAPDRDQVQNKIYELQFKAGRAR